MKDYFIKFIFFLSSIPSFSQVSDLNYRKYTVAEGLPSNESYYIMQDKKGYIWISTDGGICRFDGKKMTKYTTDDGLADNVVFHIAEDSKGRIWFNTFSGKMNYYENGKIYGIPANDELIKIANNGTSFFRTMCFGKNDTLYLGSGPSGYSFKIAPNNNYSKVIRNALPTDQRLIIFTPFGNNKFVAWYNLNNNLSNKKRCLVTNERKLLLSADLHWFFPKNMMLAEFNGGYFYINADGEKLFIDKNGNCSNVFSNINPINAIFIDRQRNIWIGIHKRGVLMYKNGDLNSTPKQYFSGRSICNIIEDNEGGMWFASLEEGVFYSPNPSIRKIPKSFFRDNQVGCYFVDSDTSLLVGLMNGDVYKFYSKDDFDKYKLKKINSSIYSISEHDNRYFFGHPFGMHDKSLEGQTYVLRNQQHNIFGDAKSFLRYSGDSMAYINSANVIFINKYGLQLSNPYLIPGRFFKGVMYDKKEILLACMNGLWKFKNEKYTLYKDAPELKSRINDIALDKSGNIWTGTDKNGAIFIDRVSQQLRQYSIKDGLPSNKVNALIIDAIGNVWVATNSGIAVIDLKNNQIKKFNVSNGLLNDRVKKIICRNDELWMATDEGICISKVNNLRKNLIPPGIFLSEVLLNNEPVEFKNDRPVFSYKQGNFSFLFDGISFKKEGGCNFMYQLKGYETGWRYGDLTRVDYSNLPDGDYVFSVFSINNDGIYSKQPATFAFKITPPFWKTWWFIALMILLWLVITYRFITWRIGVFKKRIEAKEKINKQLTDYQLTAIQAQMNPHFIFNVIGSIQNYILDKDTDEAYDYLSQFARLIRLILQHSKENYVSVEKELEMLKLYVSLEQLRMNKKFDFVVDVSDEVEPSEELLPVMLIQPYIENSIWHGIMPMTASESGIIKLSIQKQNGQLMILIDDNGIGREKSRSSRTRSKEHESMAMTLNEKRLSLFNASVEIIDKHDAENIASGTQIKIVLDPLSK